MSETGAPRSVATGAAKEEEELNLPPHPNALHPLVNEQMARDILFLLVIFRFINALCVRTFFQPDEYFQSLEPAWQMAFGPQSGAWITWEWQHQLRSSLHPAVFAIIYYIVDKPMELLEFFPQFRAMILSVVPNVVQAFFAAAGDYYTWQLAQKLYGTGSNISWTVLLMTLFSPWQWFCSTRTFSNSLETTLTIAALYFWPWEITVDMNPKSLVDSSKPERPDDEAHHSSSAGKTSTPVGIFQNPKSLQNLRISLLLSCTACILRPTNAIIWFCVFMPTITLLLYSFSSSTGPKPIVNVSDYLTFARECLLCGFSILLISALSDRAYFGFWTFPPYQWLYFNVNQDLAVFYGSNDWHYFFSQGLPLLLTTYLPFTLIGIWNFLSLSPTASNLQPAANVRLVLSAAILQTLFTFSLISHKEVRFIYPLLPLLHIITAPEMTSFFYKSTTTTDKTPTTTGKNISNSIPSPPPPPQPKTISATTSTRHKPLLYLLLLINLLIAGYTSFVHQSGVISVVTFLRHEYEDLALDHRGVPLSSTSANIYDTTPKITDYTDGETFVAFLMPCHSTPWRSQLIHPGLKAWALSCEPPLDIAPRTKEREEYRDEADRFFDNPGKFLREEVGGRERPWPRFVVGFEGIEESLREYYDSGDAGMKGWVVRERWRAFNSHWHDDKRRTGDVVVWEFVDGSKI